jgi:hypothetical protein
MASIPTITPRDCVGDFIFNALAACEDQPAKVAFLAIIDSSYVFTDVTDPVEWAAQVVAEVITIVPCRGELPVASPNEAPASGRQNNKLTSFTYTSTVQFDNPDGNFDLMQALNFADGNVASKSAFLVMPDFASYVPLDDTGCFIPIYFNAAPNVGADITLQREGNIILSWTSKQSPYLQAVPSSIFV